MEAAAFLKNTYWNSDRKSRFLRLTPDQVLIVLPFDCSMKPSTYTRCVSSCAWFRLQCSAHSGSAIWYIWWYIQMPNHFSWTLDTHAKLENIVNVKLLIFLKLTYYSIIVELHIIGNHRFFVSVKLTYLIRDFVTNASILVIRLTIFPVFCFAMLKWSSLINFNKLDFAVQVGQMRVKTKSIVIKIFIFLWVIWLSWTINQSIEF